jgi:N,N'-diacetyllegionaminate synthase
MIKIGNKTVGEGQHCFIIAEAGVNHNGEVKLAEKLISIAKEAGATAVKFQTWKTEEIVTKQVPKPEYQKTKEEESHYDMVKKLELSEKDFKRLANYAKKIGIIFLSTPEGKKGTDMLDELPIPAYKIGSSDLTNYPHLEYVAKKGKPIILSTGMATMKEVKESLEVIKNTGNNEIILLHCTSNYPTRLEDVNLRAMLTLKKEFKLPIGYSDHTIGIGVSVMAAYLGAMVIEKHITIDQKLPGPDHSASLEPNELKEMIKGITLAENNVVPENMLEINMRKISNKIAIEREVIENIERILGSPIKKPVESETEMIRLSRKYLVAGKKIAKGSKITEDMIGIKKSDGGLEPKYLNMIIGKKTRQEIKKDEALLFEKLGD